MSYGPSLESTPSRDRINLDDPYEVRNWSKLFGVSDLDVAIAVRNAGPKPADVAFVLGRPWPPARRPRITDILRDSVRAPDSNDA
ncbi:DUF3606 domain-containing protein [Roseomonas sp. SSH11]|uniref:DUF3606 domain-containing protein n=1 Tax=Pararoseomonas baculiformis TaxID=2820812 RepID=A0ABS4AH58_9PROT|nr:DUF3606 domain-containing protein [Pararoseomonas baculiformis]MBP0446367.1 DUF3606 domain-containing protein [Pararoseomonas baculiformis]